MLRIKSFDISDDKGMNELLDNHRLASNAGILVSNGKIAIPYEDGAPESSTQKANALSEEKADMQRKIEVIEHSQDVLLLQEKALLQKKDDLEKKEITPGDKKEYDQKKEIKEEIKKLENQVQQTQQTIRNNQEELDRYYLNLQVFDKRIESCQK